VGEGVGVGVGEKKGGHCTCNDNTYLSNAPLVKRAASRSHVSFKLVIVHQMRQETVQKDV